MRLGFHYHVPAIFQDGRINMPGYLGRFVDSLAENCDSVVCFLHSPTAYEISQMDYSIESSNVELVDIGVHDSVPKRLLRARKISKTICMFTQDKQNIDVMLVRAPTPLLPTIAKSLGHVPISLLVVGDNTLGVDDLPQPSWRKEIIRLFEFWNKKQQLKIAINSLTFVNSHQRYLEYKSFLPNVIETRTTTLRAEDFFERQDTCNSDIIRLLFVGRLDRAKGLFDIIEAMDNLVNQGVDMVLDLVGWAEKGDTIIEELSSMAARYGFGDRLVFHGYQAIGPELFEFYKKADIFVIASQASEGFPRSIWEAMAHSLPVVATRVGSIPDFIEGSAKLVAPNDPEQLAHAIMELIGSDKMRHKFILRGRKLAKGNTLESQTKILVNHIKQAINN